ncbi:MAG: hypothetical protein GX591_19020 [Planctomycetes bacterium]|nr:hypothetical protein [Planctomycetota bacterium]
MPIVSPHAVVECPANLAEGVVVGPFAHIGPDVHIGAGTRVEGNVTLVGDVRIGAACHIYPFAVVGHADEDGRSGGQVRVGDRCNIREHAVIRGGDVAAGKPTALGTDNLVMTGCYIGEHVQVGCNTVLGNYSQLESGAVIEDRVWAAAFTGVSAGVTVGRYSFTSGYAGIHRDAPPYAVLQGFPFRVRGVNTLNLRRWQIDEEQINRLKAVFRDLYEDTDAPVRSVLHALAARTDLDEHERYLVSYLMERNGNAAPAQEA